MADYVIEPDILEADLFNRLLEVSIVEHLQGVPVDEQHCVSFDLRVAGLDQALIAGLLPPLVAVQTQLPDPVHLVLPLQAYYL